MRQTYRTIMGLLSGPQEREFHLLIRLIPEMALYGLAGDTIDRKGLFEGSPALAAAAG